MCRAGEVLGKDLAEVGELMPDEVATWAAYARRREEVADLKAEMRSLAVCTAVAAFYTGKVDFEPIEFYPVMFKEERAARAAAATDAAQIERRLMAWSQAIAAQAKRAKGDRS